MKKTRFLSLVLAMLMIASTIIFSGCGESEEEKKASANTSTREIVALNMYILTEDSTTEEAADRVQMAINEILLPNYKTMLKINYLTRDEYWDAVDAAFEETDLETSILEETNATVVGTEKMDFAETIEYIFQDTTTDIELSQPQIDILVVDDYDIYTELANDEKLAPINSYLDYDSKILKTSVHPTFMSAAQVGTSIYGVPTNIGVDAGEYTYLIFNEDLLKKYGYEIKDLTTYSGTFFANYMAEIKANEPGIWPVSGPLGISGAEFYDDAFIVVPAGLQYIANDCKPTFMYNLYNTNQVAVENYKKLGYYPTYAPANAKYAIEIETSPELLTADEDKRWTDADGTTYVRYLFDIPRVSVEEAFSSVMCISNTSPVPERAMEIITLFQTNKELANLLQYGIEGVNYQIDERDGSLIKMDDTYAMNNLITGNTFIKYPENNDKDYLEKCIKANLGTAPSAFLGFNLDLSGVEKSQYETVKNILIAGNKAVENGASYDDVRKIVGRELLLLGYEYVNTTDLAGIYGKVQLAQRQLATPIAKNFRLSEEIMNYNAHCGMVLEEAVIEEIEEETAEGEEAAEGEETAEEATEEAAE